MLKYLKKYRRECVCAPLFKMLEALFDLLVPLAVASIIDRGIGAGDAGHIWRMCGLLMALGLVGVALGLCLLLWHLGCIDSFGLPYLSPLAEGGFGCDPKSSGRAIFAVCLSDGEKTRWNREDFTGVLDDDDGIALPKTVVSGYIIKNIDEKGQKRYDFQFINRRGYKTTIEGLSERFNKEYWNYAKLISGVLRYRMPLEHVIRLVGSLSLNDESINTWKVGVERALKKYIPGAHDDTAETQGED